MAVFTHETFSKFDDYMTPKKAWEDIKDYIPKKIIWESFFGDGKSGEFLTEMGFEVIHKDEDFFKTNYGEVVISNPPFSKKKEILTRLKELDKPFILIMPSSVLQCKYMKDLFNNEIQLIIPSKRIQFDRWEDKKRIKKSNCNFACFYYCYKIGLANDITFL